jgi:type I restriction enzyme S subunit
MKPGYLCPKGYKQTEVGVIPEDWEVSSVGREFEIKLGKMIDAEKNVGTPKPYLGNRAVQWDRIDISNLPTVPMSRGDIQRFRLQKGDLLVCEGGDVGRAAIWEGQLDECYFQKALHRLRPLRGFNSQVMAALLRQWSDKGQLTNFVTQTSIAHLPREKFMEVPMPVPPLPEQRAIATALSDVDGLLGALDRLIAKKRDLKQAAMQQLLTGQTRLPGFKGEWVVKRLGDVVDGMVGGGTPSRNNPAFWGDEIPWVTVKDFATFNSRQAQESITKVGLKNSASHLIPAGTLITSTRMALGKAVVYEVDVAINQDLKALFLKPTADRLFVYYWFEANTKVIDDLGSGSTVKGISIAQLKGIAFPGTILPEQTAIASVLSEMDAELAALEQRRDKTRALKQGMMQELLTGRTRLV